MRVGIIFFCLLIFAAPAKAQTGMAQSCPFPGNSQQAFEEHTKWVQQNKPDDATENYLNEAMRAIKNGAWRCYVLKNSPSAPWGAVCIDASSVYAPLLRDGECPTAWPPQGNTKEMPKDPEEKTPPKPSEPTEPAGQPAPDQEKPPIPEGQPPLPPDPPPAPPEQKDSKAQGTESETPADPAKPDVPEQLSESDEQKDKPPAPGKKPKDASNINLAKAFDASEPNAPLSLNAPTESEANPPENDDENEFNPKTLGAKLSKAADRTKKGLYRPTQIQENIAPYSHGPQGAMARLRQALSDYLDCFEGDHQIRMNGESAVGCLYRQVFGQ